jgi:pyruvate formate lyase activating enzyme
MNDIGKGLGLVFNIQRFSLHDGPGIRDLVFMKGCPLRCRWCFNPESQKDHPEVSYNASRCIGRAECGRCLDRCSERAIKVADGGTVSIDWKLCTNCGKCALSCPAQAIKLIGEYKSVDEVVKVVEEDGVFYSRSRGGVTISGGESSSQAEFVFELLAKCQSRGINTAIETCGYSAWENMAQICMHADLVFYDIKHMDPHMHKAYTGVDNKIILENLKRLSREFPSISIVVRTPIIPGFTDSEDNIQKIARFVSAIRNPKKYDLLPYHRFGEPKYGQLGRDYPLSGIKPPDSEQMENLRAIVIKESNN